MKGNAWLSLALVLALSLPLLAGCSQLTRAGSAAFDDLASAVPGDVELAFFYNFRLEGKADANWKRIRQRMEATPSGQEALQGLLGQFRVEERGLAEVLAGPAVHGNGDLGTFLIMQVEDEEAVKAALWGHPGGVDWQEEQFEGQTLYHGRDTHSSAPPDEWLAWSVADGRLYVASRFSIVPADVSALVQLRTLLSLKKEDSLADLPSWKKLRGRLPKDPMGLFFVNTAEQVRDNPPPAGDTSLNVALGQRVDALAVAAVPEREGMRVELVGTLNLHQDDPPALRALPAMPAADPMAWSSLPADTAIALVAHDASVVWPWLKESFGVESLDKVREVIGLDLDVDLARADGPLGGEFAVGFTPPLPGQPISHGIPAAQMLALARDATEDQVAGLQVAMEGRGAIFGPGEAGGVPLQTQVGTELSGYAISFGFDEDTLLFGSSPGIVEQAVATGREGDGLVETANYREMVKRLGGEPSIVAYLNVGPLASLLQTNMTAAEYMPGRVIEAFEAIGLGLRLDPDELEGRVYFLVAD